MAKKKKGSRNWLVPGIVILVLLFAVGFMIKVFLEPNGARQKTRVSTVTLLKPPPEQPKDKLPEPEMKKEIPKDTMTTQTESPQPQNQPQDQQNAPPAGADLGVEGDASSGSDGFGLVAKGKGKGRDVTLGGGGSGGLSRLSLLTKYGWYTAKIQDEVKKQMRKRLDQDGGLPKGKFQVMVKITLDAGGTITKYQIVGSSGNEKMDAALKSSLPGFRISQPLPEGMPSAMTVRINSQG